MKLRASTQDRKAFQEDTVSMIDNQRAEGEKPRSHLENDLQYATRSRLIAIMVTISLSTMVAALDLVRTPMDRNRLCRWRNE
jgi:uncharacterized membrane protein